MKNRIPLLLFSFSIMLNSCNAKPFLSPRLNELKNDAIVLGLDPQGSGTIDPSALNQPVIVESKGKNRYIFNKGDNQINYKISLANPAFSQKAIVENCTDADCVENSEDYQKVLGSDQLGSFKEVKGEMQIDDVLVPLHIKAESIAADLSFELELLGLAENSTVRIKGTAYDINDQVMGSKEFENKITKKLDTVKLEILLDNIQNAVDAQK